MDNKIIEYYRIKVYGINKYYANDPKIAEAISKITGQKTLVQSTLNGLKELGFDFKEVLPPK